VESARLILRGPNVSLRPYREDEAEALLEHWLSSAWRVGGTSDRAAMRRRLRQRIARSGRLAAGRLELAIDVDGRIVGDIEARHPQGALPPGVYEIGIEIHAESSRGRGHGTEAVRLMTGHLFDAHEAARVQASTAVWNGPMRAVLRRLGFVEEGILQAFMPTAEGRDDYVLYAVTAESWRSGQNT
jgi:RimJ/RimL family protein N-acetyltransferase